MRPFNMCAAATRFVMQGRGCGYGVNGVFRAGLPSLQYCRRGPGIMLIPSHANPTHSIIHQAHLQVIDYFTAWAAAGLQLQLALHAAVGAGMSPFMVGLPTTAVPASPSKLTF
jgi:hypothetical protein